MENGKEKRTVEKPNRDPLWDGSISTDVQNRLVLPAELKKYLASQEMDYRFLNASQFREAGNYHKSDWRPFNRNQAKSFKGHIETTAEGLIQRGDLILGIRPKSVSAKHRAALDRKNQAYSQVNVKKAHANALKEQIKDSGLGEHVSIDERDPDKSGDFED